MVNTFQKQRLLYCWMPQASISNYIKSNCIEEEEKRLKDILKNWANANNKFNEISSKEKGLAESIEVKDIPQDYNKKLEEIKSNVFFQRTFEQLPIEFKLIEIDKLIACQNLVMLDYIKKLTEKFSDKPNMEELINICLSLEKDYPPVSELKLNEQTVIYSSENTDFRFLGAVQKPLEQIDLKSASSGGIPIKGLLLLFGYGGASVNILKVGKKMFLNNGFHRVYALREKGVTHIPAVVQIVKNHLLEFPNIYQGVPREYLLTTERPPLMKDYFDDELTIEVKAKARRRGVKVVWLPEPIDVPL